MPRLSSISHALQSIPPAPDVGLFEDAGIFDVGYDIGRTEGYSKGFDDGFFQGVGHGKRLVLQQAVRTALALTPYVLDYRRSVQQGV